MPTAKQASFYNALIDQIQALPEHGGYAVEVLTHARTAFDAMSAGEASEAIDRAKNRLAKAKIDFPAKSVPSGDYALVVEGVVKFYRVRTETEGKWAGYTFVDAQASDEYHKVGREAAFRILAEIGRDPQAAMALYGQEIGRCGHCHRKLTSEWRKRGIGPVCVKKMGW